MLLMYMRKFSKETTNVATPLGGKVLIVDNREKIPRGIWISPELREKKADRT